MFLPQLRITESTTTRCRACNQSIPKGTDMISWYAANNQGMYIHLCLPCVSKIDKLLPYKYGE